MSGRAELSSQEVVEGPLRNQDHNDPPSLQLPYTFPQSRSQIRPHSLGIETLPDSATDWLLVNKNIRLIIINKQTKNKQTNKQTKKKEYGIEKYK